MVKTITVMVIAQMYQVIEVLQQVHQVLPQVQVRAEEEQQGEINMSWYIIIGSLIILGGLLYWLFWGMDDF
tara:strand:- start:538 stop:750 length:213 start_codon:yes stop_codon:yes gene_type:complete